MKIFITADTMLWKPESKALRPYRDDVIIVETSSHRCKNPHDMKVISSGITQVGLGQDYPKYIDYEGLRKAVAADEELFEEGEDLVVLADNTPSSLIILKVLQAAERKKHLHLWAVEPFTFEGKRRREEVLGLLSNLSGVTSALIEDLDTKIAEVSRKEAVPEAYDYICREYEKRLPDYLKKIRNLTYAEFWPTENGGAYFYDLKKEKFISTRQALYEWTKEHREEDEMIMGFLRGPDYLALGGGSAEEITRPYPRHDGKRVCAKLRELRNEFVKANGLGYEEEECMYDGPCAGTCKHCDDMLSQLDDAAEDIAIREGIDEKDVTLIYPEVEISGFETDSKPDGIAGQRILMGIPDFLRREDCDE